MFLTFCFVFYFSFGSQLIFLLLVFSSSHAHGRLYRKIIGANGAKEITTQDNSFSNFLGPKDAVNDAFEELSETERGDMDKGKRRACQKRLVLNLTSLKLSNEQRKKFCEGEHLCHCKHPVTCESCSCTR